MTANMHGQHPSTRQFPRRATLRPAAAVALACGAWCWGVRWPEGIAAGDAFAPHSAGFAALQQFQQRYCVACHAGAEAEAQLDLSQVSSIEQIVADAERWERLARRVHDGEMPPPGSEAPDLAERTAVAAWIRDALRQAACGDGFTPGPALIRRLNRQEYAATLRDLLGLPIDVGATLPSEGAGGEGFDNAAETLFVSPVHAEKYLDAARQALRYALQDPPSRARLLPREPAADFPPQRAASAILEQFLPRAFRRPVPAEERALYEQFFAEAHAHDPSFAAAMQATFEAVLLSPKFLFRVETPAEGPEPELLSDYELAGRLSYFLWTSMPDDRLLGLAAEGRLHDPHVLEGEIDRLLHSELDGQGRRLPSKLHDFASSFTEQWLGTRALGREFRPDPAAAGRYDAELEGGLKYEPVLFFEEILADNRSVLALLDADFTYVNSSLARHYGLPGDFSQQPQRVALVADGRRGGVLGMGAVLAVSSLPHRTSPVLRGKWILETLLGAPPPPPPANVPQLPENSPDAAPATLRARLQLHRQQAACAACHERIDPLGFGLENYDVLGRWRTESDGLPIDSRGRLPDGTEFAGPADLKQALLARKDQFVRLLTARMLGFALGRGLVHEDYCTVDQIAADVRAHDYASRRLVRGIVMSVPFRYKQGRDPSRGVPADVATGAPAETPLPADGAPDAAQPDAAPRTDVAPPDGPQPDGASSLARP